MIVRCLIPMCQTSFDQIDQGRVLTLNSGQYRVSPRVNFSGCIDRVTYVWLCDACLCRFEVSVDLNGYINLVAKSPNDRLSA